MRHLPLEQVLLEGSNDAYVGSTVNPLLARIVLVASRIPAFLSEFSGLKGCFYIVNQDYVAADLRPGEFSDF